jgi:hypothetical protein
MRRTIFALVVLGAVLMLGVVGVAGAEQNAVTPSTNDINRTNGWAHVDQLVKGKGTTDLQFISTRAFYSCFEYRTDGDTSQKISDTNYNPFVTDGLYPYTCRNNNSVTLTIDATAYVEVRMVFGAETDERFDWTRFDVDPKCTATGFTRDGIDLTAAQIGGAVTGTLDATGCNIGAYNPESVDEADIFGANYFGVVANDVELNVTDSSIHAIGESPLNGAQHGNAVVYLDGASGTVSGNSIFDFQKNGITISGADSSASVLNNVVAGEGQIDYIAQNGIQVSFGATALVKGNTVSGHWYTPKSYVSCGLLFYQANGVKQQANTLFANEINLCNVGRGGGNFNP